MKTRRFGTTVKCSKKATGVKLTEELKDYIAREKTFAKKVYEFSKRKSEK